MNEIILSLGLVGVLYWYFNIRGINKCIRIEQKCDDVNIQCIKPK
jgi:hypothetical protein